MQKLREIFWKKYVCLKWFRRDSILRMSNVTWDYYWFYFNFLRMSNVTWRKNICTHRRRWNVFSLCPLSLDNFWKRWIKTQELSGPLPAATTMLEFFPHLTGIDLNRICVIQKILNLIINPFFFMILQIIFKPPNGLKCLGIHQISRVNNN